MTATTDNRAKEQAQAQLGSIINMVKRLEHARDCNGFGCTLTDQEIAEGINIYLRPGDVITEDDRDQYHDEDDAMQVIQEDPLHVQVRNDWHSPGDESPPAEYNILLCTGGPAVRIIGELNEYNEPETADLEYQDWFTAWERLNIDSEEEDALIDYARTFCFGY